MNTRISRSKVQSEFGVRWLIAALLVLCAIGSAHAQNRTTTNAQLHISVTVVPIVQAQQLARQMQKVADASPIAYHLQPVELREKREIRDQVTTKKLVGDPSAVLETSTTVAD